MSMNKNRLFKSLFLLVVLLTTVLFSGCEHVKINDSERPKTKPLILKFYFTQNSISISRGDVTSLIIELHYADYVELNGQSISMGGGGFIKTWAKNYDGNDFNKKAGNYGFHLQAFNNNGETAEGSKTLQVVK